MVIWLKFANTLKQPLKITSVFFVFLLFFISSIVEVHAASATLQLSPSSGSYNIGQTFSINVLINTGGGRTATTDMVITFPASKIILTDIQAGTVYDQYVGKNINNSTGVASINGLASSTSSLFTGSGTFATLNFKAIDSGTAEVKFSYTPGKRTDTNVVDFDVQDDILTSITNGTYTISGTSTSTNTSGAGTNNTSTTTNNTTSGSQTTTTSRGIGSANNMPVTASSSSTILLTIASLIFIVLGALLTKLSF